ncbi:glycosyltransferase [Candidatus Gottesmanbacteria bacterium]|nr:glycosyltransferase [Candidatus Gottesmanbacteria bacterium]
MKIFCVIPALNEEGNLSVLTTQLVYALEKEDVSYTIFFVLQGHDGSKTILNKLRKKNSHIEYVYYPKALGIGRSYRTGFQNVNKSATHILTLDADLNHNPADLHRFLTNMAKTRSDIVIGSRFIEGGRFDDKRAWKRIISKGVNSLIRTLMGLSVHDATSGYRLITKKVIVDITAKLCESGYPFYPEFILRAQKAGFTISEIPITYAPRMWGKSKMGKVKTLYDYIKFFPKIFLNF